MAEQVPEMLQEMRVAYRGGEAETPGEKNAVEWFRDDPKGFRAHMVSLEKAWLDQADEAPEKSAPAWDGKGKCPTCGLEKFVDPGTEHCIKVAEQWLKDNAM